MSDLSKQLTPQEKAYLLNELFGYSIDEHGVIFDADGDEFTELDMNTLYDFFIHNGAIAIEQGKSLIRKEIRDALGCK